MPLPASVQREAIHERRISMQAWRRVDGLYDVEAHLVDTKPFAFQRVTPPEPVPAGQALHDLWLRLVLDDQFRIHDIVAASDVTPFPLCREATATLSVLVGESIGRGWSKIVRERLGGHASCTHLAELMLPIATTAMQGIRGVRPASERLAPENKARQIDTCYAFDARREVVATVWPQFARRDAP
jgi:hypothetical protein